MSKVFAGRGRRTGGCGRGRWRRREPPWTTWPGETARWGISWYSSKSAQSRLMAGK